MTALHNPARAALHAQWLAARNRMTANPYSPRNLVVAPEPEPEPAPPPPEPIVIADPVDNEALRVIEQRNRIRSIVIATAAHFGLPPVELVSERRTKDIVRPRMIAMYLAKKMTPLSFPRIGRHFGGRDHTTVLNGVWKIEALIAKGDATVIEAIEEIVKAISGEERTHG